MTTKERWGMGLVVVLAVIVCTIIGFSLGEDYGSARTTNYWSDWCYDLMEEREEALTWRVVGTGDGLIQLRNHDLLVQFRFNAYEPENGDFVQKVGKIGYDAGWILVPSEVETFDGRPPIITGEAYIGGKPMSEELEARGLLRKR